MIPVGEPLNSALDAAAKTKTGPLILVNSEGAPWTPDGFSVSWRKACAKAGVAGVTFHDLRGTAVTRLALAGVHASRRSPSSPGTVPERRALHPRCHYLNRDRRSPRSAIRKLETENENSELTLQTGPNWF